MHVLKIRGGRALSGSLSVPGSKNAALAILSAVPMASGPVVLHNVPDVRDVAIKLRLLGEYGVTSEWREGSLFLDPTGVHHHEPDEDSVRPIRTGFYLLGPLLARVGRAVMPAPGGCKIGARPVDFHLKGLAALGARIELASGAYIAEAPNLVGTEIYLDFPSAGATQHLMATAALAQGVTTIQNAAMEPEITTLAEFLNRMGARVEGAGSSMVTITGVERLEGCEFRVPEDRLQAGTFLLAGAITGGDLTVKGFWPEPQAALVNKLREAGIEVDENADWVRVRSNGRPQGVRIKTMPYPGFPTDMQQPMAALLAVAEGNSVIEETIYESRIGHVPELVRMGADMRVQGRSTVINGVPELTGAVVEASDLRAGAALVLAGLAAAGETVVKNIHFIDRGYENLEQSLRSVGADIERTATGSEESAGSARES